MDDQPAPAEEETAEWFEGDWVRVSEYIDENGVANLHVSSSEMLTPWKMLGMLQAATEFQATMTTNIFYGMTYEDMVGDEDDEDQED